MASESDLRAMLARMIEAHDGSHSEVCDSFGHGDDASQIANGEEDDADYCDCGGIGLRTEARALLAQEATPMPSDDLEYCEEYGHDFRRGDWICKRCGVDGQAAPSSGVPTIAEVAYRVALETILQWDMINPPRTEIIADLAWLRGLVETALAAGQFTRKAGEP
jgi:hypothetical protein